MYINAFPGQIMTNFDSSKTDLTLKYRLGLEHALARADFLNVPNIIIVQAFAIFLFLVRRHDSPRFVWMMTGLIIRMAQSIGLQRDGTNFEYLTPFEIEMRRKVWWAVCMLDLRASEDQGTELTIGIGSFDTKLPLNINDADIDPESKQLPTECDGVTELPMARICDLTRKMMAPGSRDGAASLEDQTRLLNEIYHKFEEGFLQYPTESGKIVYWVGVTIARLVVGKMTLIHFLPVLFSSPSEDFLDEMRIKLLVSAIEVAEYNHELNAEQACRHWRWVFQTYTHWYAIVYLLIATSQRPWSPLVERAWVALHSSWLIPAQSLMDNNLRIWLPLRKLMAKGRKHRDAEITRLRADPQAAARLETEDKQFPVPSSSGPFPTGSSVGIFRERWRQLVAIPKGREDGIRTSECFSAGLANPTMHTISTSQPTMTSAPAYSTGDLSSSTIYEPTFFVTPNQHASQIPKNINLTDADLVTTTSVPRELALGQTVGPSDNAFPTVPADWSDGQIMGPGFVPWLWADADPSADVFSNFDVGSFDVNMDLDGEVDWYNWVESAKGMEWDAGPNGSGWT